MGYSNLIRKLFELPNVGDVTREEIRDLCKHYFHEDPRLTPVSDDLILPDKPHRLTDVGLTPVPGDPIPPDEPDKFKATIIVTNDPDLTNLMDILLQPLQNNARLRSAYIIKSMYGSKKGKRLTLEEIGKNFGITRERVRQIKVATIKQIQRRPEALQPLIESADSLLNAFQGIISTEELAQDKHFQGSNRQCIGIFVNLIVDVYPKTYRIINRTFLTNLKDRGTHSLHLKIDNALFSLTFPISKNTLVKHIISSLGNISRKYLRDYLTQKKLPQNGNMILLPSRMTILDKLKYLLGNIDQPIHIGQLASIYRDYFKKNRISISRLEHSLRTSVQASKDFVMVSRSTFMSREKFPLPHNIKRIVSTCRSILRKAKTVSDTRYLLRELQEMNITLTNINEYSLKSILTNGFGFKGYKKFGIGLGQCEETPLKDQIYRILQRNRKPMNLKEIYEEIRKRRVYHDYVIGKCIHDNPIFKRVAPGVYTLKRTRLKRRLTRKRV